MKNFEKNWKHNSFERVFGRLHLKTIGFSFVNL